MAQTVPMKRVVIVGDETVGYRIVKEIRDLGATGYNYTSFKVMEEAVSVRGAENPGTQRSKSSAPLNWLIEFLNMSGSTTATNTNSSLS